MKKGTLVLQGKIKLLSPLLIGTGQGESADIDVIRDGTDIPFIPATSFIGMLKHTIQIDGHDSELKHFWGFSEDDLSNQSAIRCSDLTAEGAKPKVVIRDGIKIDNATGIVEDKAKYDYEVIERKSQFKLRLEIDYSEDNETFRKRMLATIQSALIGKECYVGAKTNNGLGRIKLIGWNYDDFDFTDKKNVVRWLCNEAGGNPELAETPFDLKSTGDFFSIDATFDLPHSLISRTYPAAGEDTETEDIQPDTVHIKSAGEPVLTGASLKGAIRARAERIVNTIGKPTSIIEDLFGAAKVSSESKSQKKGRVKIDEVVLPRFISELQTRIQIDRFTGGTIEGALVDSKPVFTNFNDQVKNVKITIRKCKKHEAGLLLLVLKDLWTGDLAVGGEKSIGRGVFRGVNANITWNDEFYNITDPAKQENKEELEAFVNALKEFQGVTIIAPKNP
ncbi:MAG: RAMP superfamily CRISPR-associated protein, partial [bacterium]